MEMMRAWRGRFGIAELVTLGCLCLVAAAITVAFLGGWTIALVPGVTFALAMATVYLIYRQVSREEARLRQPTPSAILRAEQPVTIKEGATPTPAALAAFRVVEVHGVCLLGRKKGDLVTVNWDSSLTPELCPYAQAVLQLAAKANGEQQVGQWCCPIYDHLLVFQRERVPAEWGSSVWDRRS